MGGGGQVNANIANLGSVALVRSGRKHTSKLEETGSTYPFPPQYSTFSAVGFVSGVIINRLGARLTLGLGAACYALVSVEGHCIERGVAQGCSLTLHFLLNINSQYIGSFLSYNINGNSGFVIASGAICKSSSRRLGDDSNANSQNWSAVGIGAG